MGTVTIRQQLSAAVHPGQLIGSDIEELGLQNEAPAKAQLGNVSLAGREPESSLGRRDAGVVTIVIGFVLGGIAGGSLQEAGKEIYGWVKTRLLALMEKKRRATQSSTDAYSFRVPVWCLEVSAEHGPGVGFTAMVEASKVETMEQAVKALVEHLESNVPSWDLSSRRYHWFARQTISGLHIGSDNDEL